MGRPVVCVVGAGTAGLEALLGVREQLQDDVELRLIAPNREFRYRPINRDSLFSPAPERAIDIADLVAETDADWVRDRVAAVHQDERRVITRDGDELDFDFLLLAPGSRPKRALRQGYVWERGGDPGFLDQILSELAAGDVTKIAVVVPRGARWPLPAYELALILGWSRPQTGARVALLTAEERPLGALGAAATNGVTRELEAAGVELSTGVELLDAPKRQPVTTPVADLIIVPESPAAEADALIGSPTDPARLRLPTGEAREYERLISLPTLLGPGIPGIATDAAGFVLVDTTLKVCASERVWAAGGCIAAALEHSALSAQQADAAVAAITAQLRPGSGVSAPPELTGFLLSQRHEQWLAENPVGTPEPSTRCLWWPPGRAAGRMLARRIAAWDPTVDADVPSDGGEIPIRVPLALQGGQPIITGTAEVTEVVRDARLHDLEQRQLMAVDRNEREAAAEINAMAKGLDELARHQQDVIATLRKHGYLWSRG
ncbi:MAG TPA: FAD-dependent oxidoreductase [Solirubrobacteraceae bacterium]|nr:FAD-dependent oxidoreductase [Solirubrobacteraceae bacterium]